jgi:ribosomal protein L40E
VVATQRLGAAIALIVFGVIFAGGGAAAWNACASSSTVNGVAPDCSGFEVPIALGVILVIVGIVVLVVSAFGGTRTIYPTTDPAVPPPLIQPVVVQQTVVQQTVEVRCRYCEALNPVTATKCSSCGAAL